MGRRYEILLSDAARADFDRLQAEAESCAESSADALRQLLEVHALLDQIAAGEPAEDSLVPGTVPEPGLRYRSEGGVYLYFQRHEETRTAIVTYFCDLRPEQMNQIARPAPPAASSSVPELTDLKIRDIPHGIETETAAEFTDEDGRQRRMRSFARKVDWGDSYTVFTHSAMDDQPPRTMITSGRKGPVEGDWRKDVIEVVELLADGSTRSYPPQTVPVWLRNPFYEATSKKDMLDRLRKDPVPSARLEEIKRFLEKDADSA